MAVFWQLLRESTIIQGIIALVVLGAFVGRLFQSGEVDPELIALVGPIIGFYFGVKVARGQLNNRRDGGD